MRLQFVFMPMCNLKKYFFMVAILLLFYADGSAQSILSFQSMEVDQKNLLEKAFSLYAKSSKNSKDSLAIVSQLRKSCDVIFLVGLSMGGGTVLNVAASVNNEIAGLILVNPMIHVKGVPVELAFFLSRFQKMRTSVGDDIKRPGITEWGYDALPTRGIHQLLKMLRITRRNLGTIKVPVQLFHSVDDHTLPVTNTEIILSELGSTNKSRIELVNSYHVATMDYDQELIFQNSLTFIEANTP